MNRQCGTNSLRFEVPPVIEAAAGIVGRKECEGPLGAEFDRIAPDDLMGTDSWEAAESEFQREAFETALNKGKLGRGDIRYLFAGDLENKMTASSFGLMGSERPLFGVYGACSTMGESLALGAMTVAAGYADRVACVTSSHFGSAERAFRFSLNYANQRPKSSTWTVTGAVGISAALIFGYLGSLLFQIRPKK